MDSQSSTKLILDNQVIINWIQSFTSIDECAEYLSSFQNRNINEYEREIERLKNELSMLTKKNIKVNEELDLDQVNQEISNVGGRLFAGKANIELEKQEEVIKQARFLFDGDEGHTKELLEVKCLYIYTYCD